MTAPQGMKRGLTSYGDADFSLFLRKAFVKAMGLSDDALARPIVGIANTFSDYNACHGNVPQTGRRDQARRDARRRPADGVPDDLDPRVVRLSDEHVPAQPDGDGHRGDAARAADGLGRADRRLRQDHSRADDGRGVGRRAGGVRSGRADARRPPPRRDARRVHRLPAPVERLPRRPDRRRRDRRRSTAASRRPPAPAW